jgi:ATP adenylyltransferase
MQPLFAPWRMELIEAEKPKGCIFCLFPSETGAENDRKNLILGRTRHSFAILNKYPYNSGHLMIIPRRHTADFASLPQEEFDDLHRALKQAVNVVKAAYKPEGMNVGMNLGRCAGAGIEDHLHYHIVPRWGGDTNFMPVFGETKVIIEHLLQAHDKMRPMFDAAFA